MKIKNKKIKNDNEIKVAKKESEPVTKPLSKVTEEKDLSQIMMPKKAKRLYQRMHYGIQQKKDKIAALIAKREQIEKEQTLQKKRKPEDSANNSDQPKKKKKKNKKKKKTNQKSETM